MNRTRFAVGLVALCLAGQALAGGFKKIDAQGQGNMIFASQPIEKGQEAKAALKDTFGPKDKIYGRGYLPGPVGKFVEGEEFLQELWIDGKLVSRGVCKGVQPQWEQSQLYLFNTGEDEFDSQAEALEELGSGKHEVTLFFVKKKFLGTKKILSDKGAWESVKEFKAVYLSKGTFSFVVP